MKWQYVITHQANKRLPSTRVYHWFILLSALILASCTPQKTPQIRVGTNLWPGYEILYVAREQGAFKDIPIRFMEYRNASQVIDNLLKGNINMAALTLDEVIRVVNEGLDIKIIWVFNVSNGADALVGNTAITQLNDIKGKRIGVERTAVGEYMLHRILQHAQLTLDDVTVVDVPAHKHVQGISNSSLDAVITFEPYVHELTSLGFNTLFTSKDLPNEIIDVLAVQADFAQRNSELVGQFIDAYAKQVSEVLQAFDKHIYYLNLRLKLDKDELKSIYAGIEIPTPEQQLTLLRQTAKLQDNITVYRSALGYNAVPKDKMLAADIVDLQFLERVK